MSVGLLDRVAASRAAHTQHVQALATLLNHPGHPDQKVHGRKKKLGVPDVPAKPAKKAAPAVKKEKAPAPAKPSRAAKAAPTPAGERSRKAPAIKTLFPKQGTRTTAEHNDRVADAVAQAINGEYPGGLHVDDAVGSHVGGSGDPFAPRGHIEIGGTVKDADGNPVGHFRRTLSLSRDSLDSDPVWTAGHEELFLDDDVQGAGFARAFNANLFDWYRRSGIERVDLAAGSGSGGYAWASQGFDFRDRGSLEAFFLNGEGMADPKSAPGYSREAFDRQEPLFDALLDRVEAGEWVSAYELSQLGREPGQGKDDWWIGKALLLGGGFLGRKPL